MKWLFQLSYLQFQRKKLFLQVPFCEANEKKSKNFLNIFHNFTGEKSKLIIRWDTQNIKSIFPLQLKIYILHARSITSKSKHLNQNINHMFTWSLSCSTPNIDRTQKTLEAIYIALMRPIWMNSVTPIFWLLLEMV